MYVYYGPYIVAYIICCQSAKGFLHFPRSLSTSCSAENQKCLHFLLTLFSSSFAFRLHRFPSFLMALARRFTEGFINLLRLEKLPIKNIQHQYESN